MYRFLLFLAVIVSASARLARAQDVSAQQQRAHVLLVLPPGENERILYRALSHAGVQFDFRRIARLQRNDVLQPAAGDDGVPRVFIDLGNPFVGRICIADGHLERFLLRELDLPTGLDELGREALAQAVEASMAALLDGQTPGLSREQASQVLGLVEDARLPVAAPTTHPLVDLDLSLGYGGQVFAQQIPVVHGPSAGLAVTWRCAGDLGTFANLGLLVPRETADMRIGVRLSALTLRAGLRWGGALSAHTALEGSAGAGLDVAFVTPRPGLDSTATLYGATRHLIYVAQLAVTFAVSLSPEWQLTFTPTIEGDMRARHYDVRSDGQLVPVLEPYRVRPGLIAGVRWK